MCVSYETEQTAEATTLPPDRQKLWVKLDKKGRAGKTVTLISGFIGTENDLKELGKMLKNRCGVGGTTKDQTILIQGDSKQKVIEILKTAGYTQTKPKD